MDTTERAPKEASTPRMQAIGVDWITSVIEGRDLIERARWRVGMWQAGLIEEGWHRAPAKIGPCVGSSVAGVAFCESSSLAVVQVTSARAGRLYEDVGRLGGHVSRLDLQCTYEAERWPVHPPRQAYRARPESRARGRQQTKRTYITATDGGATCYVGSPASEHRLRVYDKGVEQGSHAPRRLFRWELQARRKVARSLAARLDAAACAAHAAHSIISAYCRRCGVDVPGGFDAATWDYVGEELSTTESTIRWLKKAVAPSIARCVAFAGSDRILEALGLNERTGASPEPS